MKIVFLDTNTVGDVDLFPIEKLGDYTSFEYTTDNEVIANCKGADIVISNKVYIGKEAMDRLPKLKLICVAATGTNNVDMDYAAKKNIMVKNVAAYSSMSVVQHTFALLFSMMHSVADYDAYIKSKDYSNSKSFTCMKYSYDELSALTWGIVGLGNIGRNVAKLASAFGANVVYYSTSGKNSNPDYKSVSFDELLVTSDIISIHAPLNDKTYDLFKYDSFERMKNSAIIVNVGRGGILNEKDLAKALNDDQIKGAALDVFEKEPLALENPLLTVKNKRKLILSPHIAWASVQARERLIKGICNNIISFK